VKSLDDGAGASGAGGGGGGTYGAAGGITESNRSAFGDIGGDGGAFANGGGTGAGVIGGVASLPNTFVKLSPCSIGARATGGGATGG
jgi:hypothetical protein